MTDTTLALSKQTMLDCGNGISIPQVSLQRQYWFIRSNSGEYYKDFTQNNYVALGWEYLNKDSFLLGSNGIILNEEALKLLIEKEEKIITQKNSINKMIITKILKKTYSFIYELEVGDIVVLPSKDTEKVSIGIITSDFYENPTYKEDYLKNNPETEITLCPFSKRRNVHWLKHITKSKLDIYLARSLSSHEALTCINEHAQYINRNIYDAYILGNEFHQIIRNDIEYMSLDDLYYFAKNIRKIFTKFSADNNLGLETSDISIQLNINSPLLADITTIINGDILPVFIVGIAYLSAEIYKAKVNHEKIAKDERIEREKIESNERIEMERLRLEKDKFEYEKSKETKKSPNEDSDIS